MQRLLLSAIALCTLTPVFAQQNTIVCSSQGGGQQTCPANTRDGVLLVREQSNNVCKQGSTWMYERRGIQVSGGCSAEFAVSNRGNDRGNGYGNNGYGNNGQGNNGYGNQGGFNGNNDQYGGGPKAALSGRGVTIPQGTQLAVRMDQTVRLAELNQGDFIPGSLASDLSVGGQVVAPAGTPVQAKVNSAKGATLDLRLDSMTVNGQTYALQSNAVRGIRDAVSTGDQSSARGGFGAVLSGLASAGEISSGTVFNFRLTSSARPAAAN